jgi:hypothetical protein
MLAKKLSSSFGVSPLVGSVTYNANGTAGYLSSVTVNTSSLPIKSGDLVIVICSNDEGSPGQVSGFDDIYKVDQPGSEVSSSLFLKSATGPISSLLVEFSNPGFLISIVVAVFRGYTYSSYAVAQGTSGLPDPPNISSLVAGDLVVACGHLDDEEVALSAQSGFTLVNNAVATSSTNNGTVTTMSYAVATSSSLNPGAFTGTGSDVWYASTLRLAK